MMNKRDPKSMHVFEWVDVFEPRSKEKTKNYVIGFERSGAWEKSDWNYRLRLVGTHVMHSDIKVNIRKVRVLP